jgi:hypothetical protein
MSEESDRHLIWWVLKALDAHTAHRFTLLREETWQEIGAPDWVYPAIRARYQTYDSIKAELK